MDIAALILSFFGLTLSIWTFIRFEAKERSTHNIQFVPVDQYGNAVTKQQQEIEKQYQEFDAPESLDEDEKEYFKKQEKIQ